MQSPFCTDFFRLGIERPQQESLTPSKCRILMLCAEHINLLVRFSVNSRIAVTHIHRVCVDVVMRLTHSGFPS